MLIRYSELFILGIRWFCFVCCRDLHDEPEVSPPIACTDGHGIGCGVRLCSQSCFGVFIRQFLVQHATLCVELRRTLAALKRVVSAQSQRADQVWAFAVLRLRDVVINDDDFRSVVLKRLLLVEHIHSDDIVVPSLVMVGIALGHLQLFRVSELALTVAWSSPSCTRDQRFEWSVPLCSVLLSVRKFSMAKNVALRALASVADHFSHEIQIAKLKVILGSVELEQRHLDQASVHLEEALRVFQERGDVISAAGCHHNLGVLCLQKGSGGEAGVHLQQALLGLTRPSEIADVRASLAIVCWLQGDVEAGGSYAESAISFYKQLRGGGDSVQAANCLSSFGSIALRRGAAQIACDFFRPALAMCGQSDQRFVHYCRVALQHAVACMLADVSESELIDVSLQLVRVVDFGHGVLKSTDPQLTAFGLRQHIDALRCLMRLQARFGSSELTANVRSAISFLRDLPHRVIRALCFKYLTNNFGLSSVCPTRQIVTLCASARHNLTAVAGFDLLNALVAMTSVDDDIIAQLLLVRIAEQEILALCAMELASVHSTGTSARVRNLVSDLFIVLLNVLDQVYARFAVRCNLASQSATLYFPIAGSRVALFKLPGVAHCTPYIAFDDDVEKPVAMQAGDALANAGLGEYLCDASVFDTRATTGALDLNTPVPFGWPGALDWARVRSRLMNAHSRRAPSPLMDALSLIENEQPFSHFNNDSDVEWLGALNAIANDNKHVKMPPHEHSGELQTDAVGLVDVRNVVFNVVASGPTPTLYAWSFFFWHVAVTALTDAATRRQVSRLVFRLLRTHSYLQHVDTSVSKNIFVVAGDIVSGSSSDRARRLERDIKSSSEYAILVPYVSMIVSFLEMRIGWQDPSNSVVDLQDEMSFDLLALMERSIRGTCDLVATMSRAENNVAGVQSGLVGELSPIASTLVPPAPHFVATTLIADITAWVDNDDDGRRAMPPVFVDLITTTDLSRASAIVRLLYDSERHLLSEGELLLPMRMWHYMGKALHAGGRSVQISLARYSWQRCADVLDVTAGDLKLIQLRCESLAALCASACHPDSPLPDFGRLCVAKVNAEMIGEPLRPIAVSELAHIDDDLVDQLEYCFAAVDRLRAQSLQLHRVDGDDVLLRNEMTVTLCVALGKCRAVLEHAFTRFARSAIWAPMSKRPPPELTFQAKFPEGVDSTSFRADILRQLHCNHDVFDNANAAVWSALESVQGYACDEPWLSELCSLVNESKHERVHLVEHARLREWWTPARSVDDGFPLYVRDEHFFPWSFWRECGDAQISKALIACLSDEGILFPWRSLLRGKNRRSSLSSEQVADLATEFPTINVAPLVKRIGNAHFINADMISRCNKYFNEVSKSNTSRTVISRSGWVSAKVYGKLSSQEREVVVLRMREESRKCADRLVALGALSTGPAMVYSVPPSAAQRVDRGAQDVIWTRLKSDFQKADLERVRARIDAAVAISNRAFVFVTNQLCVGGVAFLLRCTQGTLRVVGALANVAGAADKGGCDINGQDVEKDGSEVDSDHDDDDDDGDGKLKAPVQ